MSPEEARQVRELEEQLDREWMSRRDAARLMDVTGEYIHALARDGRIATLGTPIGRLYRRSDVERLTNARGERRRGPRSLFDE